MELSNRLFLTSSRLNGSERSTSPSSKVQRLKWLMTSFFIALLIQMSPANAGIEVREFASPEQEALYDQLMYELRCLVCQNENLAASHADLAKDLRDEVYEMVNVKNMNETQIKDFLVQRYGDFVLYKPPVKKSTALLWAGPFILLLLGFAIMIFVLRHNRKQPEAKLGNSKRAEVKKLLDTEDK